MTEREMTRMTATPLEVEIRGEDADDRTLTFHTTEGSFSLTEAEDAPEGVAGAYYEVSETAYENDSLSIYFNADTRFQDEYDVVTLFWPIDEKIIGFLAGDLYTSNPLWLTFSTDGRNRMH